MRGANAYQALNNTHARLDAEFDLPGTRYEELRDTLRELDSNPRPGPMSLIDIIEKRRAELDRELTELREAGRGPEPGAPERNEQTDIDRALALQSEDEPEQKAKPLAPGELDDFVAPEQWAEKGGMVEQQASALDWLKHSDEVRRERAGREAPDPATHHDLSQDDRELLAAARTTEQQTRQQEHGPSQVHQPDGP